MNRIGPSDLAVFLAIATQRSFRKAAVRLGVTPSALSHSLRSIEERLDIRLVNRTTRSVGLTEAGERLLIRIAPAFRDIGEAVEDLYAARGQPTGKLRLNAPRLAANLVLIPLIARFQRSFPGVEVELAVDNAFVDTVSEGFDAGIRFGESIAADMIAVPIGPATYRYAVVGTPGCFADRPLPRTPHDLREHPCIRLRFSRGGLYRWEFRKDGTALEIDVEGPLTVGDQDIMLAAALEGAGLAYLFEEQALPYLADGRLIRVLEDWCPPEPGFFLYYPSRRQLPFALRAFIDYARVKPSSLQSSDPTP